MNKHCFILSISGMGTSLVADIISHSKHVSSFHPKESQHVSRHHPFFQMEDKFIQNGLTDHQIKFDYTNVKRDYYQNWDTNKPVLSAKSAYSDIITYESLNKYFENCHFICLIRNPYAHYETRLRRGNDKVKKVDYFAKAWSITIHHQLNALNNTRSILLKYEDLAERKETTLRKLEKFLEIDDLNYDNEMQHPLYKNKQKISNKNNIDNLNEQQIQALSEELKQYQGLMKFLNYEIL